MSPRTSCRFRRTPLDTAGLGSERGKDRGTASGARPAAKVAGRGDIGNASRERGRERTSTSIWLRVGANEPTIAVVSCTPPLHDIVRLRELLLP